jgi:hypothetical protein
MRMRAANKPILSLIFVMYRRPRSVTIRNRRIPNRLQLGWNSIGLMIQGVVQPPTLAEV